MTGTARAALRHLAPPGSRARAGLSVGAATARDLATYASGTRWRWRRARSPGAADPDYALWLAGHRPSAEDLKKQRDRIREAALGLGVDCLVLNVAEGEGLERTLRSLRAQTLQRWSARVAGPLPRHSTRDRRITQTDPDASHALERVLSAGDDGSFVLLLLAGDVLEPDLLFHIAARGWDDPSVDLVHWDDDLIDERGMVRNPRFRPEWSPDMLLSANYLGRSFAVRRKRLKAAGGLAEADGDARFWDLLLRLDLNEEHVARVPRILQHVRVRPEVQPETGTAVVSEHLRRTGRTTMVDHERGAVRVRWRLDPPPSVSIVIPTRRRETLLARCLDGIERTDYPAIEVVVVDSGERHKSAERWYRERSRRMNINSIWWEGPFNYSAANNCGASASGGEVVVFLNDDTEVTDPQWLRELVSWAIQPGIGLAGMQLIGDDGLIQHGGVVVGMSGFAGHLFSGMDPDAESLLGSTTWYRNCLSVTAACVAVRRSLFEEIGGFDERFTLCGSDVVLGLDARMHGRRVVCSPYGGVRHVEGQTRDRDVPTEDFFSSYWRYQHWLRGGDPYFSPGLSLMSTRPRLRDDAEPDPLALVGAKLGRNFSVYRQTAGEHDARSLVKACRADRSVRQRVLSGNRAGATTVRSISWFLPNIDNPFYGGVNTALRIADLFVRRHGVENHFVVAGDVNEHFVRSAVAAAFPALGDSVVAFSDGLVGPNLATLPASDVAVATHWHTAYLVANFERARRRCYLIQDFEPSFYPAGSIYALAEESYRLGLYGICNTTHILDLYRRRYGGEGFAFTPAVDASVFHPRGRKRASDDDPVTIFAYSRPGHWRNCWEMAQYALRAVKRRLGHRTRIVTAGSWSRPDDLGFGIEHLGLLDYRETGELYRNCDFGLALTVSEHPSYLPLELLACGTPVVAFDNPAGDWILRHERNCLRCPRTADGLIDAIERLVNDPALRRRLGHQGIADVKARHSNWDDALAGVYRQVCGHDGGDPTPTEAGGSWNARSAARGDAPGLPARPPG